MIYLFRFFLFLLCFSLCAHATVKDLLVLPQDPYFYIDNEQVSAEYQISEGFIGKYFSVWDSQNKRFDKEYVAKRFDFFRAKQVYGANKQRHDPNWFDELKKRAGLKSYPNKFSAAIITKNTDLRFLPTTQPAFYNFDIPGEGFPFDNLQESFLVVGTPIFVSHISNDGSWAALETAFGAFGWVSVLDLVFVDKKFIDSYKTSQMVAFTKDDIAVQDENMLFRFKSKIGCVLPFFGKEKEKFKVYIPAADVNRKAVLVKGEVFQEVSTLVPFGKTAENFAMILSEMIDKPYGWGGCFGNRDCSTFIKDFFIPFGVSMPRNSTPQSKQGRAISLKELSIDEKKAKIKEKAIPFQTLIWWKGHITLYIGQHLGEPVVIHNAWALKTFDKTSKKTGREPIRKSVITTLEAGKEIPEVAAAGTMLEKAEKLIYF